MDSDKPDTPNVSAPQIARNRGLSSSASSSRGNTSSASIPIALDEAVRLRLRADVPVGCYLSGGLDSCSVLGLAMRHRSEPIRAFTLTFDRVEYDEGAVAREMAAAMREAAEAANVDPAKLDGIGVGSAGWPATGGTAARAVPLPARSGPAR